MAKIKCWEAMDCSKEKCPAYNKESSCWLVSGTLCRDQIQGKFVEKIEACMECKVFNESIDASNIKETIRLMKEQFGKMRAEYDSQREEMEATSMELALGLSEAFEYLKKLSEGNFDINVSENFKDELLIQLARVIKATVENLKRLIFRLKASVNDITSTSTEIAASNEQIILKAKNEIKITSEASTSVTELTASIEEVAGNSQQVYNNSTETSKVIKNGYKNVESIVTKANKTNELVLQAAERLAYLQERAQDIEDILKTINRISEKIDLLALNAAIEASSVGESGRRFRVVANEMRKLADDSMKSSAGIETVLMSIRNGIESGVKMVNDSVEKVTDIMTEVNNTGQIMKNVVASGEESANLMKQVSLATSQQAHATDMFASIIKEINIAAQETLSGIENSKVAIDKMLEISDNLKTAAEKFKT